MRCDGQGDSWTIAFVRFLRFFQHPNKHKSRTLFPSHIQPPRNSITSIGGRIDSKSFHVEGMSAALEAHFDAQLTGADRKFGNARYERNLFEKLLEHQSNRVATMANPTETDISTLEKVDLESL